MIGASQRGFAWWVKLLAVGALVGALSGLYWMVERHGYQRGMAVKQGEWDRASAKARDEQLEREKAVSVALAEADTKRQAAQDKASNYYARWQEAKRESQRSGAALAVCGEARAMAGMDGSLVAGGGEAPAPAGAAADAAGGGIRFTHEFVRLYDGAWASEAGESVFDPDAWYSQPAGAGAASPYGPEDVLEVHGENARRCSEDRQEFRALMQRIRDAEQAWEATKP